MIADRRTLEWLLTLINAEKDRHLDLAVFSDLYPLDQKNLQVIIPHLLLMLSRYLLRYSLYKTNFIVDPFNPIVLLGRAKAEEARSKLTEILLDGKANIHLRYDAIDALFEINEEPARQLFKQL